MTPHHRYRRNRDVRRHDNLPRGLAQGPHPGGRRAGGTAGQSASGPEAGLGGRRTGTATAHQGAPVREAMGEALQSTSTWSRESFLKARQSATSASLSKVPC
ncbi:MAG: hypothetical protein F4X83_09795 [Chloroflexi bacterium]|nr:hypothetical protein [Chloroflexota bacterium]